MEDVKPRLCRCGNIMTPRDITKCLTCQMQHWHRPPAQGALIRGNAQPQQFVDAPTFANALQMQLATQQQQHQQVMAGILSIVNLQAMQQVESVQAEERAEARAEAMVKESQRKQVKLERADERAHAEFLQKWRARWEREEREKEEGERKTAERKKIENATQPKQVENSTQATSDREQRQYQQSRDRSRSPARGQGLELIRVTKPGPPLIQLVPVESTNPPPGEDPAETTLKDNLQTIATQNREMTGMEVALHLRTLMRDKRDELLRRRELPSFDIRPFIWLDDFIRHLRNGGAW